MSTAHIVNVHGRLYRVFDDVTTVYQVVITGQLIDEISGVNLDSPFRVTVSRPDLFGKAADGGIFVVAGFIDQAFPDLALTSYNFTVTVERDGYRPVTIPITIPIAATFPQTHIPTAMRPLPVRLQGRVTENTAARNPIPNTIVSVATPNLVELRTPVHFDHAAGTTFRARTLTVAGAAKTLMIDARGGTSSLFLNNTTGIATNSLLRLGVERNFEFVVVDSLGIEPGQVTLRSSLRRSLFAGATVQRMNRSAIGTSRALALSMFAGDGLAVLTGALNPTTIEIVDGPNTEYAITGALSDADGFWSLDGIGGVIALDLTAAAAGFIASLPVPLALDYRGAANIIDFRLSP
jgi:hypothetical protein